MRLRVDPATFERQRRRYELRFCCEDCAYFFADLQRCAHFWPVDDHRRARYDAGSDEIVFCKEFELR